MPLKGLARTYAMDEKRFTTTLYGNGPGHIIINGSRPDVNASVAGTCCQTMMEEFLLDIPPFAVIGKNILLVPPCDVNMNYI